MKFLYRMFIFLIFTIPLSGFGQITITQNDVPSAVGTQLTYFEANCENITFDVESAGANYFWDFSQADTITGGYFTDTNLDPALSPLPNVNLLVKWQMEIFPGFFYIRKTHMNLSSVSLLLVGYETFSNPPSDSMSWEYDPDFLAYQFPITYQSNWSSTATVYRFTNGVPTDTTLQKNERIVDGWGQIQTPYQLYDCLRLKILDSEWSDSLGTWDNPDTSYYWLANTINVAFLVTNYCTDPATGHKIGFIRYYDPTGVKIEAEETSLVPRHIELYQNYPNPFNPSTTICFTLPQSQVVRLEIYNVLGQKVKTLFDGKLSVGNHRFTWDGRNDLGTRVASGIYLYRLKENEMQQIRKMVLLR